ncbi:MAG: 2Fe-2S iron-sulfur cluster-binding protein [Syntrophales bacterium]|jgi:NADH dehydrogenase/NADH:ubiquinone oxidoreductase subunit G|nr:2Fe-2S iron-sulfur cluster-binding protein [Syntrophales bacterium]MCK9392567.1 2Fe-2S iron-sulfur cluster-binding protein [Syntrophales bacterium]
MAKMIINGHEIQAKAGATVLEEARKLNIDIPTLCYHKDLSSFGACRLCMVEIKVNGKWHLAASCQTEAAAGMEVRTDTDNVRESRKLAAALLYFRYPQTMVVRDMAAKLGVDVQAAAADSRDCILCGLCTRTCHEIVGVNALKFKDRGLARNVEEPKIEFDSSACIGCGSCAFVCPTGFVSMEAVDGKRIIWDKVFKMAACNVCGRYFAPVEQLEFISKTTGVSVSQLMTCVSCR